MLRFLMTVSICGFDLFSQSLQNKRNIQLYYILFYELLCHTAKSQFFCSSLEFCTNSRISPWMLFRLMYVPSNWTPPMWQHGQIWVFYMKPVNSWGRNFLNYFWTRLEVSCNAQAVANNDFVMF